MPEWNDIKIIFDATSAKAHHYNFDKIKAFPDKKVVDLTPAAIGPYVIPAVSFDTGFNFNVNLDLSNVNMVTCGDKQQYLWLLQ